MRFFPAVLALAGALHAVPASALTCAVRGDSIAKGVGAFLPGCNTQAVVGIPASKIVKMIPPAYDVVIISAGSNLPSASERTMLPIYLERMRARATGRVIWIVPSSVSPKTAPAVAPVRAIAVSYGDAIVTFKPGADRVHPASYLTVARDVAKRM